MSEARWACGWRKASLKCSFYFYNHHAHSESLKRHIAAGEEKSNFTWPAHESLTFPPRWQNDTEGGESVVPVSALNTEPSVHWTSDRYISRVRLVFCTPAGFSLQSDEPWLSHVCSLSDSVWGRVRYWEQSWWCDTGPRLKRWKCSYCA